MPVERRDSPTPRREREFGFTANEVLFDRMSHARFMNLFDDETTTIHRLTEEANSYGEFLFVTLSRPGSTGRIHVTFWGAGYHEYRERWLAEEWFWYFPNFPPAEDEPPLDREEAREQLNQRLAYVQAHTDRETQSRRGELFELLADLTDEDGAWAELQDLPPEFFDGEL